jgi:two-component system, NtrC family, response regulator HydG
VTCPILIVDDDEDVRFLLSTLLKRRGFEVETVDSAASCLKKLSAMPACVVVTDYQMPGMSGLELCTAVRERHPGTVAIVMSGAASPALAARAIDCGAFQFLPKPVSASTLEATLPSALAAVRDIRSA